MVLNVLNLRPFGDGWANAVVSNGKYRHSESERGLKLLPGFYSRGPV
jgi:hypothetical protein